ncbi:DUF1800 family protein [Vibrio mediterranei]|uniref:DUF1800 domain-containing protein n=1 Tax=Vibrio mediterranei TaxID=689 RepID=A0AAN1FIK4_9VIBR|nr:DUF1800 family protein [Vibrio mediterranei]ASI91286.1 hypothetical protein BSZ05_16540 [Vibrio mediterranei]
MQTMTNKRAHQLLLQASMGFKSNDVDRVFEAGSIETWVDNQTNIFRTSLENRQKEMLKLHHNEKWTDVHFNLAYTDMLLNRNDILRHRISYILTQLFVVSNNAPNLSQSHRRIAFAKYYDSLSKECFSTFEVLLRTMARSPVMGQYLTYLDNDHRDGVSPDENFAREIMQLFSIGPAMLNMDGSVVMGSDDRPVPSYTQDDIENGAKVMTGWGLDNDDWLVPMQEKEGAHNTESKTILDVEFAAGQSAEQDLEQFISTLCSHPNVAPFISKFFIQKMVSSNPSPDYIARVSSEFKNSGLDMVVLIKAILTDSEAKYERGEPEDGLVRDPLIVLSHAMRALNITLMPGIKILPDKYSWKDRRTILHGPSVFYYYQPEEAPNDDRFTGHSAAEFKLYNWDDIYHYFRQVSDLAVQIETDANVTTYMKRDRIVRFYLDEQNGNSINQLIEELKIHLFASNMSSEMETIIRNFLADAPRHNTNYLRALLIQIIMSPDFITQG